MPQNFPGATSRDFTRNREYHKIFRRYAPEPYKWCGKAPNFRRYAPKTHHQLFPHRYSTRPRSSHERHVTKRFYCRAQTYTVKLHSNFTAVAAPQGAAHGPDSLACPPALAPAELLPSHSLPSQPLAWL